MATSDNEIQSAVTAILDAGMLIDLSTFVRVLSTRLPTLRAHDLFTWFVGHGSGITVRRATQEQASIGTPEKSKQGSSPQKLSPEEFIFLAIERLRDPSYKSIHMVYSGFNGAFREYFKEEGLDPIAVVDRLVSEGKLSRRFVKGGALISHDPSFRSTDKITILKKMGVRE